MLRSRATARGLLLGLLALPACSDGTAAEPAATSVTLVVTAGGRSVAVRRPRAGFFPYSPGPTPETRAVCIVAGTGAGAGRGADSGGSVELFKFLPSSQDLPDPGTYPADVGASPANQAASGGLYFRRAASELGARRVERARSSVTLDSVSAARIVGRFTIVASTGSADPQPVTVTSAFVAERAAGYRDLPVPVVRQPARGPRTGARSPAAERGVAGSAVRRAHRRAAVGRVAGGAPC